MDILIVDDFSSTRGLASASGLFHIGWHFTSMSREHYFSQHLFLLTKNVFLFFFRLSLQIEDNLLPSRNLRDVCLSSIVQFVCLIWQEYSNSWHCVSGLRNGSVL